MSRTHSIIVQINTKTKQDVGPASTIGQDSQFVVTNPEVTDEQVQEIMAWVVNYLQPNPPVAQEPEVI